MEGSFQSIDCLAMTVTNETDNKFNNHDKCKEHEATTPNSENQKNFQKTNLFSHLSRHGATKKIKSNINTHRGPTEDKINNDISAVVVIHQLTLK